MTLRFLIGTAALALAMPLSLGAQSPAVTGTAKWADSASREIEIAHAASDLARLTQAAALLDRALTVTPNDRLLLYYRSLSLYRLAAQYMGRNRNNDAKKALEEADRLLEQIETKAPAGDALALRGAVVGQLIGLSSNPLSGMTLGPKASGLIERAMELEPNNPRVWLVRGISSMFTPKMFGGGTDKAERDLRKAAELFAAERVVAPAPSWGHADAYIWLGQTLQKEGKAEDARAAYEKALELSPSNAWVTQSLLPSLSKPKE
ncbi:MAG TPA: tetratricopeptide repeat protein [Gemmatimonadaceae bacterium]|jgi:tetratricopeptide (TPR) repeat protein|nr:tetratricopeptide repeat protein [Gemmatimonadaceae bacterium]